MCTVNICSNSTCHFCSRRILKPSTHFFVLEKSVGPKEYHQKSICFTCAREHIGSFYLTPPTAEREHRRCELCKKTFDDLKAFSGYMFGHLALISTNKADVLGFVIFCFDCLPLVAGNDFFK